MPRLTTCMLLIAAFCSGALPITVRAQYVTETRTLEVSGANRSFILARPAGLATNGLPLVISMHGDGGNPAAMRAALPLELAASAPYAAALFAYPKSRDSAFEYWSDAGRAREAAFVLALIDALDADFGIDVTRVYLIGFSGGATMANALGCRLGRPIIRGLGIHSGTLYPVDGDFGYTATGGVDCALPPAIFVWGKNDVTGGVSYANGVAVLGNYKATHGCSATGRAISPEPCVAFDACSRRVTWCAIEGLGHAIWGAGRADAQSAATAIWNFIAADAPPGEAPIFADGFDG